MRLLSLVAIIGLCFLHAGCKTSQELNGTQGEIVLTLCGQFTSADSSNLVQTLVVKGWNTVALTTPFDNMGALLMGDTGSSASVRPLSRYFISEDTLFLEMDKGYLCYRIIDQDQLEGISAWNQGNRLIRHKAVEKGDCPTTHLLTPTEKNWLSHSRRYYQAYYHPDMAQALVSLEGLCAEDYGPACMSLGRAVFIKDKEQGLLLLQKACELGYYGNYACYQLAEALSKAGKREAAITAYLQACEGGHTVGCWSAQLLQDQAD